MPPALSIVTVTRNGAATIADCLASVRAQTLAAQHVVIDGASSDGTLEIVSRFRSAATVVVSEPDRGIYDAMNKGIALCTGDVVGTLNADDGYAHDSVLERVARLFEDGAVDACYGDLVYIRHGLDGRERTSRYWRAGPLTPGGFLRGWMPPHPTFFVRRRCYEELGGYRLDMGSAADYELMLRFLLAHQLHAAYLPEVLVKMRCGGASNRDLASRVRANRMDRRAWAVNGLTPRPWTLWIKPLRKLPQWVRRPPRPPAPDGGAAS